MSKKKIIIVGREIFPKNSPRAFRATELAKELARQGHEVILYAILGNYDYSLFESEFNIKVKGLGKSYLTSLTSDGETKENKFFNKVLYKLFNKFLEVPDIELMFKIPRFLKKEQNTDLLITVAVPYSIHWGGALLKKKLNFKEVTWVADCGDPFMGNKFKKHPFYFKYLEKWFCSKVDYLSIPIQEAKIAYYEEFRSKIKIIPQGFNFNEFELEAYAKNKIPTFLYAGSFYEGIRDPRKFLEYLSNLKLDFRFYIYTRNTKILETFIEPLGEKIVVNDYISRGELLNKMAKVDFLVNFENGTSVQSPSKLIDYGISKRPIIDIGTNELDEKNILAFLEGNYDGQTNIESIDDYRIENVSTSFLELIKK